MLMDRVRSREGDQLDPEKSHPKPEVGGSGKLTGYCMCSSSGVRGDNERLQEGEQESERLLNEL